jgi:glycosyltransferase involved in cell wall biosynthesis
VSEPISCIVPVHNGAAFIDQAIESILAQTHRRFEVLVVDDGSSDDTPAIVRRFGDRVRCLRQPHAGPVAARNLGLASTTCEHVAFLDADDLWHPRKLDRQIARLHATPSALICVAHVREFAAAHLPAGMPDEPEPASGGVAGYVSGAMLARRCAFERLGPFDGRMRHAADLDWFVRAREHGLGIAVVGEVLVYRRLHGSSLSRREADQSRREHLRVIRETLRRRRRLPA